MMRMADVGTIFHHATEVHGEPLYIGVKGSGTGRKACQLVWNRSESKRITMFGSTRLELAIRDGTVVRVSIISVHSSNAIIRRVPSEWPVLR